MQWLRSVMVLGLLLFLSPGSLFAQIDETRRVGGENSHPFWWPASQEAYVDLGWETLPRLMEGTLDRAASQKPFRIWHAGFEDGSQTFLLAGMVDQILEDLKKKHPEKSESISHLPVEIVATDLVNMPQRRGGQFSFGDSDGSTPRSPKRNLALEEFRDDVEVAGKESEKLQGRLSAARDKFEREWILRKYADAGQIGLWVRRMLRFDSTRNSLRDARYVFSNPDWRVVDEKGSLGTPGETRTIRFEQGDLTKTRPKGNFDLVLNTNVLPWLDHYDHSILRGDQAGPQRRALENLLAPLQGRNRLVLDFYSWEAIMKATSESDRETLPLDRVVVTVGNSHRLGRGLIPFREVQTIWKEKAFGEAEPYERDFALALDVSGVALGSGEKQTRRAIQWLPRPPTRDAHITRKLRHDNPGFGPVLDGMAKQVSVRTRAK